MVSDSKTFATKGTLTCRQNNKLQGDKMAT